MNNQAEKRAKAQNLRKQKKYSEALPVYKELWVDSDSKDKWDGWGYAYCLNQLKEYKLAYDICGEIYELDPDFDYNKSQFAWASYMLKVKEYKDDDSTEELIEYISKIIEVTKGKEDDLFRNQSILKLMDHLLTKGSWDSVIEWSKFINPEFLDGQPFKGVTSDGKKFIKPSDKENYYLKLSKALEKSDKFEECIDICDKALTIFPAGIWFKWHKGSSLRKLKKYDLAIKLLEEVKLKKTEWFILKDLAAAYYSKGSIEQAFNNFLDGCISSLKIPEPQNRWELYYIGAKILYKQNKFDLADKHIAYVFKLREENGWGINDFLQKDINERKLTLDRSAKEIFAELYPIWIQEKQKSLPIINGKIKNLISEGKAGFIGAENGNDYYFRVKNFLGNKKQMNVGALVQFNVKKSFDKKKNQDSEEAVSIIIRNS